MGTNLCFDYVCWRRPNDLELTIQGWLNSSDVENSNRRTATTRENVGISRWLRCLDAAKSSSAPRSLLGGDIVIKGTVMLCKKYVVDLVDYSSILVDNALDLLGRKVTFQLVSVDLDTKTNKPKISTKFSINKWATQDDVKPGNSFLAADDYQYLVSFKVPSDFGEIGAFSIRNNHRNEFYLISLILEYPDRSTTVFSCNSWVYTTSLYKNDRVFFSNKIYLPDATPLGLKALRAQELQELRGDGTGMRKEGERIYDYDVYNDLQLENDRRPILGGSAEYPYPRRCRTGRPRTIYDPNSEMSLAESNPKQSSIYIPRDERFSRVKNAGFLASSIKSVAHFIMPAIKSYFYGKPNEFESFADINALYDKGINLEGHLGSASGYKKKSRSPTDNPFILLDTIFDADGSSKSFLKFALPDLIALNDRSWMLDLEFGRQALAGLNPLTIELLTDFPPKSSLDQNVYGSPTALQEKHILQYMENMTVGQALKEKRLFTVDHHDTFMPYLEKINVSDHGKCYAPRTIFFYTSSGQMRPIAIELSLPPPPGGNAAVRRVFSPPNESVSGTQKDYLWELAKIHASSVDFGVHELISHWMRTHSIMEPIIIATRRQLSEMHPISRLLYPVSKNTMNINAAGRGSLINAGGIIEVTFTPGKYCLEFSSKVYGSTWRFDRQALPQDLIARGMAVPADSSLPGGVKLVIDDYPYAKDGLELWDAIHDWVSKYVIIVYPTDQAVQEDSELQSWWYEIVNVGHGDLKDAPWWPKADSRGNLVEILTIISWIAGPHHAAVNFGQYAYAGFMPNKPSTTRRFIPEIGSSEYEELLDHPEKFILSSATSETKATILMAALEILATHAMDEEYQGQRLNTNWTSDERLLTAFSEFSGAMKDLEDKINARNTDPSMINRRGAAQLPYTLLFPSSTSGLTGRGVPYSTSI